MPSPGELLRSAHSTMSALAEHFDAIDSAEASRKSAQAQLDATTQELNSAQRRLEMVKAELSKVEGDLQGKKHLINDEAARSLAATNQQIASREDDLRKIEAQIKTRREEHDNIVDGLKALHLRTRV